MFWLCLVTGVGISALFLFFYSLFKSSINDLNTDTFKTSDSDNQMPIEKSNSDELKKLHIQQLIDSYDRCFFTFKSKTPQDYFHDLSRAFGILLELQGSYADIQQYSRIEPFSEYQKLSEGIEDLTNDFIKSSFEAEKAKLDKLKTAKGKRNSFVKFSDEWKAAFKEAESPISNNDLPQYTGCLFTANNVSTFISMGFEMQEQLPPLPEELEEIHRFFRRQYNYVYKELANSSKCVEDSDFQERETQYSYTAAYRQASNTPYDIPSTHYIDDAIKTIESKIPDIDTVRDKEKITTFFDWLVQEYCFSEADIADWKTHLLSECEININSDVVLKGMDFEKSGELEKAIKCYEFCVSNRFTGTAPYDRLMVIYRKRKDYESEQRIIESAVSVFYDELHKLFNLCNDNESDIRIVNMRSLIDKWKIRLAKSKQLQSKTDFIQPCSEPKLSKTSGIITESDDFYKKNSEVDANALRREFEREKARLRAEREKEKKSTDLSSQKPDSQNFSELLSRAQKTAEQLEQAVQELQSRAQSLQHTAENRKE